MYYYNDVRLFIINNNKIMATIKKKIEFTEKELKEVLCGIYNLDGVKTTVSIYSSKDDEENIILIIEGVEEDKPVTWANR